MTEISVARERERRAGEEESEEEKERVRERREEERKRKSQNAQSSQQSIADRERERESRRRLVLPRNKRERRSRKNSSPIFSHFAAPDSFFSPLPSLTWTVTWHRMSSFAVHVSVCAQVAVDLDNSKGGSGFGRFSKGHDVR